MGYNVGFVPNMYVAQTIYDNRKKRNNSAKRNYQRMVYEFAENKEMEKLEVVMSNDEIGKIRAINRYDFG